MATDRRVKYISELDFDKIKQNLAAFIANNSDFTDYNFAGSGTSFLTDVLAYNTMVEAFLINLGLNETMIDTAQKRSSIVSLAKNFGYTPKSKKSARSTVTFRIPTSDPDGTTITFEKGTDYFTGEDDEGVTYVFSPIASATSTASSGYYTFTDLEIREGSFTTISYTVQGLQNEKYLIENFDIDTESIDVDVQTSIEDTMITSYSLIDDITTLTSESTIFYLFETTNRTYEIYFGDGVLGVKPSAGNIVNITFSSSKGSAANDISTFTLATDIDGRFGNDVIEFTDVTTSYGGANEESIESTRRNALQNFRTQGRAVTAEDYKYFLSRDYPLASSISVWGGQDNDPPIYGKVFLSFKPADGFFLSTAAKESILEEIIKNKNVVSIIPEIVDPSYLYLIIDSTVKYNRKNTNLSAADIKQKVITAIETYNDTTLSLFGTSFNYSEFIELINSTDTSIKSNITRIKMKRYVNVQLSKTITYDIDFQNEIHPGSITNVNAFKAVGDNTLGNTTFDLFIDDDALGNIRIYRYAGTEKIILKSSAGTVDYSTGKVVLQDFILSQVGTDDQTLRIIARPVDYSIGDITSSRNTILTILDSDITVNVEESTTTN